MPASMQSPALIPDIPDIPDMEAIGRQDRAAEHGASETPTTDGKAEIKPSPEIDAYIGYGIAVPDSKYVLDSGSLIPKEDAQQWLSVGHYVYDSTGNPVVADAI